MISAISSAVHALGAEAKVGSVGSVDTVTPAAGASSGFGSALCSAIGSLDHTQQTATSAAQSLATGTATDPTQAVATVENASLAMDLAAQVRDKLVAAENTIFSTQV